MKRLLPLLLLLIGVQSSFSQEIIVLNKSSRTFSKVKSDDSFHFIEKELDTTKLPFVATLKATTTDVPGIKKLYDKLQAEAKRLGANAFKLHSYSKNDSSHLTQLVLSTYRLDETMIGTNTSFKTQNMLYVFTDEELDQTQYFTFEFNGTSKSIKAGTYFVYTLREGEQVKLKKGTISGTTMWVKWKPGRLATFLTVHGFYNAPVVKRTTVSESFKPGDFKTVERGLAELLISLLKPSEQN